MKFGLHGRGEGPIQEVKHVMDADGHFWENLVSLDTNTGACEFYRMDPKTWTPMFDNSPQAQQQMPPNYKPILISKATIPTPVTITFWTMEMQQKHLDGESTPSIVDYIDSQLSRERELDPEGMTGWDYIKTGTIPEPSGDYDEIDEHRSMHVEYEEDEPTPTRFTCPCCGAPMREKYSSKMKWYLGCTECEAVVIRT